MIVMRDKLGTIDLLLFDWITTLYGLTKTTADELIHYWLPLQALRFFKNKFITIKCYGIIWKIVFSLGNNLKLPVA